MPVLFHRVHRIDPALCHFLFSHETCCVRLFGCSFPPLTRGGIKIRRQPKVVFLPHPLLRQPAPKHQHGPRCSILIASCLWKCHENIPRSRQKLLPATHREIEEDTGYHRFGSMQHPDYSEPCLRGPCLKTTAYSLQHTSPDELGLGFREVLTVRLAQRLCQEWEWCFIRCRFMRPCSSNL